MIAVDKGIDLATAYFIRDIDGIYDLYLPLHVMIN